MIARSAMLAGAALAAPAPRGVPGARPRLAPANAKAGCSCGGFCPACKANGAAEAAAVEAALAEPAATVQPKSLPDPGPDRPLEPAVRNDFEQRFDADFAGVRVHDGPTAADAAAALNAKAYTIGNHIAFGRGEFAPHTMAGRTLLAHELAHTIQAKRSRDGALFRKAKGDCGMPSFISGTPAHRQIQSNYAPTLWPGVEPQIPHARKPAMLPYPTTCTSGGQPGKADLWQQNEFDFAIGEIKFDSPTSVERGRREVDHYVQHAELSASRLQGIGPCAGVPATSQDEDFDRDWLGGIGGVVVPPNFAELDDSVVPSQPTPLGPLTIDPAKTLWHRHAGDGVVAYWCEKGDRPRRKREHRRAARWVDAPARGLELLFPRSHKPPVVDGLPNTPGVEVVFAVPEPFFTVYMHYSRSKGGAAEGPPAIEPGNAFSTNLLYVQLAALGVAIFWFSTAAAFATSVIATEGMIAASYATALTAFSGAAAPAAANSGTYAGVEAAAILLALLGLYSNEAQAATLGRMKDGLENSSIFNAVPASEFGDDERRGPGDPIVLDDGKDYVVIASARYD